MEAIFYSFNFFVGQSKKRFYSIVNIGFLKLINRTLEMFDFEKKSISRQPLLDWKDDQRRNRLKRDKVAGPSIFIAKAYEILESDTHSEIIAWNEQGTSFTIFDVDRFEQEILPLYFRHRNFSSFVRQLNMYDFHKIRNQQNKNIFQHREFRRDAKQLLKNIRRKGCTIKKGGDMAEDYSDEQQSQEERYNQFSQKQENYRATQAVIEKESQQNIPRPPENPYKLQIMEDFMASLPDIVESEHQVKQIIRQMKKDSKYRCLSSKEDVRKVVQRIRRNMMRRQMDDGLEQLSIEQQIMVQNVDDREQKHPTLAILSSQAFLNYKTNPLICSLILCDDIAYNKH